MSYRRFVSENRSVLIFGLLAALSTSFGQTFFISLFVPDIRRAFSIGGDEFGMIYGGATLLGALFLPVIGSKLDHYKLREYTSWTLAAMSGAALLMAVSPNLLTLGIALLSLRLLGQGLLGHVSQTAMAREFGAGRGKALGIAGIGYPLGEATLPVAFAFLLPLAGWRVAWGLVAGTILALFLPAVRWLLRHEKAASDLQSDSPLALGPSIDRKAIWRNWRVYWILPSVMVLPFLLTALFLYQAQIAESKGWRLEWLATAFAAFAITRASTSIVFGPLIDRFSATRLLPLYMLPLAAGIAILANCSSPWAAFPYMILSGLTAGASGSIATAVWAEIYGPSSVGKVRSFAASLAVVSAALSPPLVGMLLSRGESYQHLLEVAISLILITSVASLPATPWWTGDSDMVRRAAQLRRLPLLGRIVDFFE